MSPITTHILDTAKGNPAAGVTVTLEIKSHSTSWKTIAQGTTNLDGRVNDLMPADEAFLPGHYRLSFDVGTYYLTFGVECFFPLVTIGFVVKDTQQHYHVPLLLTAFGYTTYRGS